MDVLMGCCESEFAPMPLLSRLMWISTGSMMPDPFCPSAPPSQPIFFNRRFPLLSSGNGVLSPSIYTSFLCQNGTSVFIEVIVFFDAFWETAAWTECFFLLVASLMLLCLQLTRYPHAYDQFCGLDTVM